VALAIMAGAGVVASSAAEADPFMTVYLHPVGNLGSGICEVRIGVDINMSEADARAFIDHPGEEATAKLWADDEWYDNGIATIGVDAPTWPQTWAGGYSVEYVRQLACSWLNEDGGRDELYAQITFDDFRTGQTHRANSNQVTGYW
jgi:hypothetical protein